MPFGNRILEDLDRLHWVDTEIGLIALALQDVPQQLSRVLIIIHHKDAGDVGQRASHPGAGRGYSYSRASALHKNRVNIMFVFFEVIRQLFPCRIAIPKVFNEQAHALTIYGEIQPELREVFGLLLLLLLQRVALRLKFANLAPGLSLTGRKFVAQFLAEQGELVGVPRLRMSARLDQLRQSRTDSATAQNCHQGLWNGQRRPLYALGRFPSRAARIEMPFGSTWATSHPNERF